MCILEVRISHNVRTATFPFLLIFATRQPVKRNRHWLRLVSRSRRDRALGSCAS